jgi:predicted alpha/beta-hydrolase family hydrolase
MVEEFRGLSGRAFIHRPEASGDHGIALTHGAGSNCDSPLLRAIASGLADSGLTVVRYDLPFRARLSGPPRPADAAMDREGIRAAAIAVRKLVSGFVVAGGHSYGGRQTSIAASEDPELADGLVFLSYPLHPPRRASELRTGHFPDLRNPCLFVHGTRDPFGSPEEIKESLTAIPAPVNLYLVNGAGHDLIKPAGSVTTIARIVAEFVATLRSPAPGRRPIR